MDRLIVLKRLLAVLEEREEPTRGKGWKEADEVEVELKHDKEAALCSAVLS